MSDSWQDVNDSQRHRLGPLRVAEKTKQTDGDMKGNYNGRGIYLVKANLSLLILDSE